MSRWGVHWFRRDLRVAGNTALRENWKRHDGRVLGVFFFDSTFLSRPDFSHDRFGFFLKTLAILRDELKRQGGDLLVLDAPPDEGWRRLIGNVDKGTHGSPGLITWNRDYEPFAVARDLRATEYFQERGIAIETFRDHLLFEPHEVLKEDSGKSFYQVYSPFGKKWFRLLKADLGRSRLAQQEAAKQYWERLRSGKEERIFRLRWQEVLSNPTTAIRDALDEFISENGRHIRVPLPPAGFFSAFETLLKFKDKVDQYKERRDLPSESGTSRLSIYLKNGSLTSSQILSILNLGDADWDSPKGPTQFTKEIAWREFYYSILFHRPDVEHQSFLPQYRDLKWTNNADWFDRWKSGTTGFPIVDAGMRELLQTGWMHNRVRMIVASFLTKDLLIDWRMGENHFMKHLLDGDLAPNNGGWQWAASTGCDPQPYFRIFNPWLQSAKFDPDGTYIRKFIPELARVSVRALHQADLEVERAVDGYPSPIVRHDVQKAEALRLYKAKG